MRPKKHITKEKENDKNKEIDKVKGDDDEKNKEGNKDNKKAEAKRKKIFRKSYKCNICKEVIKRKTEASISCKACMEWCHIKKCSGLKNTKEAEIMQSTFRCQTCVKEGREIASDPPTRRGRPRGSTTSKLQHVSKLQDGPKQRSDSKKENRPIKK